MTSPSLAFRLLFATAILAVQASHAESDQYMNVVLRLARSQGVFARPGIFVSQEPGRGFGLRTSEPILVNDVIVELPPHFSLCSTPKSEVDVIEVSQLEREQELASILLQNIDNPTLPGQAFFQKYPKEFTNILSMTPEDEKLLSLVSLKELVLLWREEFDQHCQMIHQSHPQFPMDEIRWALSTVLSRSFGDGSRTCLHPIVDLCNTPSSYVVPPSAGLLHEKDGRVLLVALRNISSGEELTITYGYHDNMNLLGRYGMAMTANPLDRMCVDPSALLDALCPNADPRAIFHNALTDEEQLCSDTGKIGNNLWESVHRCCKHSHDTNNNNNTNEQGSNYEVSRCTVVTLSQIIAAYAEHDSETPSPQASPLPTSAANAIALRDSVQAMLFQLRKDLELRAASITASSQ